MYILNHHKNTLSCAPLQSNFFPVRGIPPL